MDKDRLDGKKKFTATILSIIASMVGLFFTPETAAPITQAIAVAGPLILGFGYDWFQSRQDMKAKENERVLIDKGELVPVINHKGKAVLAPKNGNGSPTILPAPISRVRVNFKDFEQAVKAKASAWDPKSETPSKRAEFNALQLVGGSEDWVTTSLDDLDRFASMYLDAADNAFKEAAGFFYANAGQYLIGGIYEGKLGSCPHSTLRGLLQDLDAMDEQRELMKAQRYYNAVGDMVKVNDVNWYKRVDKDDTTLYRALYLSPSFRPMTRG